MKPGQAVLFSSHGFVVVLAALFVIGVLNGVLVQRLYARTLADAPQRYKTAMELDNGTGRAARGDLSDWCHALRPDIHPHDELLDRETAENNCTRYVALGDLPARMCLGDRIVAWMGAAAVSLAWRMPLAISEPTPMGSDAAEEIIGLTRGLPRISSLGLLPMDIAVHGSTLEDVAYQVPSSELCNVVFRIEQPKLQKQ
jgi:hypothetical protein